ncbi:MAG: glutamyl-tRNA reductase [Betaproteobacteria bacterium]|nr:glutamyl-tRNA reductase [Betaproteobacteria bacterium]
MAAQWAPLSPTAGIPSVVALGVNHQSAPLSLREKLAFGAEQLLPALGSLLDRTRRHAPAVDALPGAAILSTCNRTELYVSSPEPHVLQPALADWLAEQCRLDQQALNAHAYFLQHDGAVRHAFRVASGLDSMVLGEPQILGQMKDAVRTAQEAGSLGTTLSRMFQQTFSVAKQVRTQTAIGEGAVSMAASCVKIAARIYEDFSECSVLLVGAGEMIDLVGTHFAAQHPRRIVLMNRSADRGEQLAHKLRAQYAPLSALPSQLAQFDIVISCTASTLPLIGLGAVKSAVRARKHKPMLMVDLAVPRDIEPEVAKLDDVFLYTVDDLQAWVREGVEHRQAAVSQAEAIIETRVSDFMHWLESRNRVPVIQALSARGEAWRAAEMERAMRALAAGEDAGRVMEQLSHRLSQKFLHGTLASLHEAGHDEEAQLLSSAERFFLRHDRREQS